MRIDRLDIDHEFATFKSINGFGDEVQIDKADGGYMIRNVESGENVTNFRLTGTEFYRFLNASVEANRYKIEQRRKRTKISHDYESGILSSEMRHLLMPERERDMLVRIVNQVIVSGLDDTEMRNLIVDRAMKEVTKISGFGCYWLRHYPEVYEWYVMGTPTGVVCDVWSDKTFTIYSTFGE